MLPKWSAEKQRYLNGQYCGKWRLWTDDEMKLPVAKRLANYPSMGLSRQEYCSGLPFPPPKDLPDPGMEPTSPALAGRFTTEPPGKQDNVHE